MTTTTRGSPSANDVCPTSERLPPLENGDHLTRTEFERRWDAMPELKKAELIEGVVYLSPAVYYEQHGSPHADLGACLGGEGVVFMPPPVSDTYHSAPHFV